AAEPTPKSKRGKTAEADVAEPVPKLKRGRAHSDLSKHDTEAVPARRIMRKSSPAPQALPSPPEPAEPAQPISDDWDWDAGDDDEDDIWCEYELWRQGLPQLSELEVRDYLPGFSSQASVSAGQPRILNGVTVKTQAAPVPRPSGAAMGVDNLGGDDFAEDDRVNSRNKVQHIIATQLGEKDEQAPDSLEDTLYWVVVQRINQDLSANCKPGTAFFDAPIPGADPGLLSKKAPAATQSAPLKADVLRAHDRLKDSMSQIAANASSNAGKEIKKNINSINDLLMDFGDVQSLQLCKGQAKGYMKELSKRAPKSAPAMADVLDQKLLEMAMDSDYWMDTAAGLYERTADLGKCRTDSKASRNIMYSLLVQSYLTRGKTNVTLQTLNSAIVVDFNKLSQEGVQVGDEVYYFIPVGFRGDLKQMCQDGNFELPWKEEPAYAKLPYFKLSMIRIDYMHTFHLGVARDLVGTALKIIATGKYWFSGTNINARLKQIVAAVKVFAKQTKQQISIKKLSKNSLGWSECPEFKGSAADSAWLATFLVERPPPAPHDGLAAVVWVANRICEFLYGSGCYLSDEAWEQVRVLAKIFFDGYTQLAVRAHEHGQLMYKM
ncbi:unnamed protein product, partial [Symbiodinium necroappetens]